MEHELTSMLLEENEAAEEAFHNYFSQEVRDASKKLEEIASAYKHHDYDECKRMAAEIDWESEAVKNAYTMLKSSSGGALIAACISFLIGKGWLGLGVFAGGLASGIHYRKVTKRIDAVRGMSGSMLEESTGEDSIDECDFLTMEEAYWFEGDESVFEIGLEADVISNDDTQYAKTTVRNTMRKFRKLQRYVNNGNMQKAKEISEQIRWDTQEAKKAAKKFRNRAVAAKFVTAIGAILTAALAAVGAVTTGVVGGSIAFAKAFANDPNFINT